MTHEEIRDRLAELATGELEPSASAEIRTHLAGCAECRGEEAALRAVVETLVADARADGLGGVPDPGARYWNAFAGRVRTKIAARRIENERRPRGVLAWLSAPRLALAAAVALVAFVALRGPNLFSSASDEEEMMAALYPNDPAMIPDGVAQLSPDEADLLEQRLFAENGARAKKQAPTPTPKPAPTPAAGTKKARTPTNGDGFDAGAPRLQDDLTDLDDMTPEQLDQVLRAIDAMKT